MLIDIYYMFVPSLALVEAAREADQEWLLDPDIWADEESDRAGPAHPLKEIKEAFWNVFLAKLVAEPPEPQSALHFRKRCLALGFSGCWDLHIARGGGPVQELLYEAKEVAPLTKRAQLG